MVFLLMEADDDRQLSKEKNKNLKRVLKKPKNGKIEWGWIVSIVLFSFLTSIILTFISSTLLEKINIAFAIILVLLIITIGIIFDMVGTAVTSANEKPFHAMASRKVPGAKEAIRLLRNVNKVNSICNDVVGDICGILSGAAVTYIVVSLGPLLGYLATIIISLVSTGLVSAMTIGGKALGKIISLKKSEFIVLKSGLIFKLITGRK